MMKYIALSRTLLTQHPFADAEEVPLAAWLRVHSYAAADGHESPVISGCRKWGPRAWLTGCQTSIEAVEQAVAAGLCQWQGDDLVVLFYDSAGQRKVEQCRANGGRPPAPGKKRGRPPAKPDANPGENREESGNKPEEKPSPFPSPPFRSLPLPTKPSSLREVALPDPRRR